MKIVKYVLWVVMAGLFGCSPVYFPQVDVAPMFTGKGEAQVSGGAGIGGIYGQAAYALSDKMAIAVNGTVLRDRYEYGRTDNTSIEASVGYFRNFDENKCFELWGGLGANESETNDSYYDCFIVCSGGPYLAKANFRNIFVQSAFGQNRKKFQWSISGKLNYLHFKKLSVTLDGMPIALGQQSHAAFESALSMRVLFLKERVFWTYQVGFSAPLTSPDFDWVSLKGSTGIGLRIGGKKP